MWDKIQVQKQGKAGYFSIFGGGCYNCYRVVFLTDFFIISLIISAVPRAYTVKLVFATIFLLLLHSTYRYTVVWSAFSPHDFIIEKNLTTFA